MCRALTLFAAEPRLDRASVVAPNATLYRLWIARSKLEAEAPAHQSVWTRFASSLDIPNSRRTFAKSFGKAVSSASGCFGTTICVSV